MRPNYLSHLLLPALAMAPLLGAVPRTQAPDAAWHTFTTPHYRIHCPAAFLAFGQEVAGRVEGVHAQYLGLVGFVYEKPIDILILDPVMEANGMAIPLFFRPHVVLWKTEPEPDSPIGHHHGWAELLVTHELGHMHHLLRPTRKPSLRQRWTTLLGPLPQKSPRWVTEGYATLIEGKLTGSGRPHSAIRASVLRQWAMEGKLPTYEALSGKGGFMGGSMAYLGGSAYLEWLETKAGDAQVFQTLWTRMAGKRDFDAAFTATFGFAPKDGYQRFCAELTHTAMELERRAKAEGLREATAGAEAQRRATRDDPKGAAQEGLREGEIVTQLKGWATDLTLSPDGSKLLARVLDPKKPGLYVWDLKATPKSAKQDPHEPADHAALAPVLAPARRLGPIHGALPWKPVWTAPDGISFILRLPDEEGVLKPQAWQWTLGRGTARAARTMEPVPKPPRAATMPGGGHPVASGSNHVDPLCSSRLSGGTPPGAPSAAHGGFGTGSQASATPGAITWKAVEGVWNLVDREGRPLTRTLAAAWNPVASPDGKWIYYTQLSASGLQIRRLDATQAPLESKPLPQDPAALVKDLVLSRANEPSPLPPPVAVEAHPYRVRESHAFLPRIGGSRTPSGYSSQIGMGGSDILGRLNWQVLAGLGDGAGPRGAMLGASWHGWAWAPSLHAFSTLEQPSAQAFSPVSGFDRERRGAEWAFEYEDLGRPRLRLRPMIASERVAFRGGATFNRTLLGVEAGLGSFWSRDDQGFQAAMTAREQQGRTGGEAWNLTRMSATLVWLNPWLPLTLRAEAGRIGGHPTALDQFHLGGVATSLLPASLDGNRVLQSALPAYTATGDRLQRLRGELGMGVFQAYLEHSTLWQDSGPRPAAQRVLGLELDSRHLSLPTDLLRRVLGNLSFTLGLHRPLDGTMKGRTVGTLSVIVRP